MKLTIKTDKYIKSLSDVLGVLNLGCYEYPCYSTATELLTRLKKANFKAMLLSGSLVLGEVKADETVDNIIKLFDYPEDYKPMIEQVIMYENECIEDVKRELWELIPTPEQAKEYIELFRRKFGNIEFPPDVSTYGICFQLSETNPYKIAVDELRNKGSVTEDESVRILTLIGGVIFHMNSLYANLKTFFNELVPDSNKSQQEAVSKNKAYSLDKDKLTGYFTVTWKNKGFENSLIEDVENCLKSGNSKKIVAIASVIYNSDAISRKVKPSTFTKWLDVFIDICGDDFTKYPPNKVKKEVADIKTQLYYL